MPFVVATTPLFTSVQSATASPSASVAASESAVQRKQSASEAPMSSAPPSTASTPPRTSSVPVKRVASERNSPPVPFLTSVPEPLTGATMAMSLDVPPHSEPVPTAGKREATFHRVPAAGRKSPPQKLKLYTLFETDALSFQPALIFSQPLCRSENVPPESSKRA